MCVICYLLTHGFHRHHEWNAIGRREGQIGRKVCIDEGEEVKENVRFHSHAMAMRFDGQRPNVYPQPILSSS